MSRYFTFIALLVVICLLIIMFYKLMAGFFVPLFLAALLVVIFRPLHLWMIDRCKGRLKLAAFLTTITVLLSVLVPLALMCLLAVFEGQQLLSHLNRASLVRHVNETRQKLQLTMPDLAKELRAVEFQWDNISEMDRLEDIANLSWQLNQTSMYNDDLRMKLDEETTADPAWQVYLSAFADLRALQSRIARPDLEGDPEQGVEPDDLSVLYHEFQISRAETQQKFAAFKVSALGGSPFWVWLREVANPTPEVLEEYGGMLVDLARKILVGMGASTTAFLGRLLLGIAIMVVSLYFFLLDGPAILKSFKRLTPINDEYKLELMQEFGKISRAVVVATLLAALVQAVLGGIGYYFAGLESVFLLTLLTGLLALVPFVGAAAVWVPCALWLYFIDNNPTAAIGLALYGAVIVSTADNLIKPLVLHGQSNLHPLLALLSVLGGVAALGPIGILIGPMVVAFLQALLKILEREVVALDQPPRPNSAGSQ